MLKLESNSRRSSSIGMKREHDEQDHHHIENRSLGCQKQHLTPISSPVLLHQQHHQQNNNNGNEVFRQHLQPTQPQTQAPLTSGQIPSGSTTDPVTHQGKRQQQQRQMMSAATAAIGYASPVSNSSPVVGESDNASSSATATTTTACRSWYPSLQHKYNFQQHQHFSLYPPQHVPFFQHPIFCRHPGSSSRTSQAWGAASGRQQDQQSSQIYSHPHSPNHPLNMFSTSQIAPPQPPMDFSRFHRHGQQPHPHIRRSQGYYRHPANLIRHSSPSSTSAALPSHSLRRSFDHSKNSSLSRNKNKPISVRQPPVIPHENDVLCGRGVNISHHSGNERFRTLVNAKKKAASSSMANFDPVTGLLEKREVAEEIIEHIKSLKPPGRFLKRGDVAPGRRSKLKNGHGLDLSGKWEILSDREAIKKTCQALRDCGRSDRNGYAIGVIAPTDVQKLNGKDGTSATKSAKRAIGAIPETERREEQQQQQQESLSSNEDDAEVFNCKVDFDGEYVHQHDTDNNTIVVACASDNNDDDDDEIENMILKDEEIFQAISNANAESDPTAISTSIIANPTYEQTMDNSSGTLLVDDNMSHPSITFQPDSSLLPPDDEDENKAKKKFHDSNYTTRSSAISFLENAPGEMDRKKRKLNNSPTPQNRGCLLISSAAHTVSHPSKLKIVVDQKILPRPKHDHHDFNLSLAKGYKPQGCEPSVGSDNTMMSALLFQSHSDVLDDPYDTNASPRAAKQNINVNVHPLESNHHRHEDEDSPTSLLKPMRDDDIVLHDGDGDGLIALGEQNCSAAESGSNKGEEHDFTAEDIELESDDDDALVDWTVDVDDGDQALSVAAVADHEVEDSLANNDFQMF